MTHDQFRDVLDIALITSSLFAYFMQRRLYRSRIETCVNALRGTSKDHLAERDEYKANGDSVRAYAIGCMAFANRSSANVVEHVFLGKPLWKELSDDPEYQNKESNTKKEA